jgi:hypothetical protein
MRQTRRPVENCRVWNDGDGSVCSLTERIAARTLTALVVDEANMMLSPTSNLRRSEAMPDEAWRGGMGMFFSIVLIARDIHAFVTYFQAHNVRYVALSLHVMELSP